MCVCVWVGGCVCVCWSLNGIRFGCCLSLCYDVKKRHMLVVGS